MLRTLIVVLAGLGLPLALAAAEPGFKTELVGGTPGEFPTKTIIRLDLSDGQTMLLRVGKTELRVSYQKVNTLEYGQTVSRRYAAAVLISPVLLLSKSRKHFVTLGLRTRRASNRRWSCAWIRAIYAACWPVWRRAPAGASSSSTTTLAKRVKDETDTVVGGRVGCLFCVRCWRCLHGRH